MPILSMSVREIMEWEPWERDWWLERAIATENIHVKTERIQRAWSKRPQPGQTVH